MIKFLILASFISLWATAQDTHIRFNIELIHHGARAAEFPVFNSTQNISDLNHKQGELTNVGLRQQYLLGRNLRSRFIQHTNIFREKFNDDQIHVRAAPYNAAVLSAYAFLSGLYTPGTGEVLQEIQMGRAIPPVENMALIMKEMEDLMDQALPHYIQTFPVHTLEGDNDFALSGIQECDILKYIIINNTATAEVKALETEKYGQFFKDLSKVVKSEITNLTTAFLLFDDITCDINDDFNLNFNLSPENMSQLADCAKDFWKYVVFGNDTVMLASVTELYREWITLINGVVEQDNANNRRPQFLAVYVGDSSQFVPVLNTINSPYNGPVDFSENIRIQMSRRVGAAGKLGYTLNDYEINIFRNEVVVKQRGEVTVSATAFIEMLRRNSLVHMTKGEYVQWCETLPVNPPGPPTPVNPSVSKIWNIVAIILEVVFLAIIIITCFFVNRRKGNDTTNQEEGEKLVDTKEKEEPKKESSAQEI